MIKKKFKGFVVFLEDELEIFYPYLYQSRYHIYKLKCDVNLEHLDALEVEIVGNLNKNKAEIDVINIQESHNEKKNQQ